MEFSAREGRECERDSFDNERSLCEVERTDAKTFRSSPRPGLAFVIYATPSWPSDYTAPTLFGSIGRLVVQVNIDDDAPDELFYQAVDRLSGLNSCSPADLCDRLKMILSPGIASSTVSPARPNLRHVAIGLARS
jgi:hypothetical protein